MFSKFNEVNLQLQGDETSLIKAKSALSAFLSKLQLYSRNLGRREFRQFSCLSVLEKKTWVKDYDIAVYCALLAEFHRDMSLRFNDLFSIEIPGWVIDPFTEPSTDVPTYLEEELVSLKNDEVWNQNSKPLTKPFGCKQRSQNATQPRGKTSSCFSLLFRRPTWLRGDSALCPSSSPNKETNSTQ